MLLLLLLLRLHTVLHWLLPLLSILLLLLSLLSCLALLPQHRREKQPLCATLLPLQAVRVQQLQSCQPAKYVTK